MARQAQSGGYTGTSACPTSCASDGAPGASDQGYDCSIPIYTGKKWRSEWQGTYINGRKPKRGAGLLLKDMSFLILSKSKTRKEHLEATMSFPPPPARGCSLLMVLHPDPHHPQEMCQVTLSLSSPNPSTLLPTLMLLIDFYRSKSWE